MREATPEELKSVNDYIKSISYNPIVKELEEIKAELQNLPTNNFLEMIPKGEAVQIVDNHINKADCDNDCEHCTWTECPKE